ncbi:hypothetical protein BaRGS_00032741 [Batillaria attramentaria]|uniref:UspA domain-containing protein n=1 Tax=Batillaria attramentaria TaxID=370345 RepID=A0ABD0JMG8_9CAEN
MAPRLNFVSEVSHSVDVFPLHGTWTSDIDVLHCFSCPDGRPSGCCFSRISNFEFSSAMRSIANRSFSLKNEGEKAFRERLTSGFDFSCQESDSVKTGKGSEAPGRRVLVGVDGSEHSNYALEWYLDHVWHHDDYVVLLNCPEVDDPMRHHAFQFDREKLTHLMKEEQDQLHKLLEIYREKLLEIGAHGKVRAVATKHVGHALVRVQEEEDAQFIVMGGRGKGTLRRTFMGSVSDYVVHHATVPVLVCRNRSSHPRKTSKSSSHQ